MSSKTRKPRGIYYPCGVIEVVHAPTGEVVHVKFFTDSGRIAVHELDFLHRIENFVFEDGYADKIPKKPEVA